MQLEVGKKYRTRDGKTVFEIQDHCSEVTYSFLGVVISHIGARYSIGEIASFDESGYYNGIIALPDDLVEEVTID